MEELMVTSSVPRRVVALADARDAARCGEKAAALCALRALGHRVPDGFVVPVGIDLAPKELASALSALGAGPYAVRSSGVAEDLADASFAGQYETVLGVVGPAEVATAIARVRASAEAKHARAYRGNASPSALAVLVQRLVQADVAGVAFSANPTTGDDEVVIEAVRGLGDRLVAGDVDGERWIVRGDTAAPALAADVLDAERALALAKLVRRIAKERGAPQDVEWAVLRDEIHVLQARPITALPIAPAIEIPPGRWQKDTGHFHGPITPIGASFMLPAYERALAEVFAEFGMPMDTIRQRSFGGEVYTQEVELGGGTSTGAAPPWWVLGIAARLIPSLRRRLAAAETGIEKLTEYPRLWETQWRDECWQRIDAARSKDLELLSDDVLVRELDRLADDLMALHLRIHFQLTMPTVMAIYDLAHCCEELLRWDVPKTMELLTGLSTATTQPTREMCEIAAAAGPACVAAGLDAVRASAAGTKLAAWLERWGLRTIDVDPGTPRIAERDALVLELLRNARDDQPTLAARREATLAEARKTLVGAARERFERTLRYAEQIYPQREDNTPLTEGLPAGLVRRVLLEIGRRLVERGVLRDRDDVAYLERAELVPALSFRAQEALDGSFTGETPAARVRRRRAERAWVFAHPGPMIHGPAPVPPPDIRGLPKAARRLMGAALWAMEHELAPPTAIESDDGSIRGIAAAPGRYTGKVRVVACEADLDRLQPGEVLVCRTTHSSWSVVFARAGALVADGGGLLAHPAIIAREHGIPAVLGTLHATTTLRTGQTVTVDGATGRVQLHQG